MTSKTPHGDAQRHPRDRQAVERQLRFALEHALQASPPATALGRVLGWSLATVVDDRVDRLAYQMAETDLIALVMKTDREREAVGFVVERVGPNVPSADDLEDWIGRHTSKKARGKFTTASIVAKIVHRGRLLGAHTDDEGKTLTRVSMILQRHHFTPFVK